MNQEDSRKACDEIAQSLFDFIKHGNLEHQEWLKEQAELWTREQLWPFVQQRVKEALKHAFI